MEYTEKLTDDEIKYVCEMIGGESFKKLYKKHPRVFQQIYKGAIAAKLSNEEAVKLAAKNRTIQFLDKFINDRIQEWMHKIGDDCKSKVDNEQDIGKTIFRALPKSVFSDRLDIYFKLADIDCSKQMLRVVKAGCKLYADYEEKLRIEKENNAQIGKENSDWEAEKNQYLQSIEEIKDELSKKTNALAGILKTVSEKDEKITSLTDEIARYDAMIKEYDPMRNHHEIEGIGYKYRSLCKVYINSFGRKKLRRLTDIVDDKILGEYSADFPMEHHTIYLDDQSQLEDTVAVWDWDCEPNIKNPENPYFHTLRNNTYIPIEAVIFEDCQDIAGIIGHLLIGQSYKSVFQKQLWCYRMKNQILEGVLCDIADYESRNDDFVKLKDSIYQLPVFSIAEDMLYPTRDGQKIVRYFDLGFPKKQEIVRDQMEIVRTILLRRFNRSDMKSAGFTRLESKNISQFIEKLPIHDIYQEVSKALKCDDKESKDLVDRFVNTASRYLTGEDIETDAMKRILTDYPELMDSCKQDITTQWEAENAEKLTKAKLELDEIEKLSRIQLDENKQLKQRYEDREQELQILINGIEQRRKLAADVELAVKEKIETARKNAAEFIAEQAFHMVPLAKDSTSEERVAVYHEGQGLPQENLDENQSVGDLMETLRSELVEEGVAERYALPLAGYMYSAYLNKMPLMIAGPCAKEIAHAFSAALFGRTAGNIVCLGDYSEDVWNQVASSADHVVIIDKIFNPAWDQLLFQTYSKQDKYLLAVTPYPEEIMIEPKGLLNYFAPLFTDVFVDCMPNQNYIGGQCNPVLVAQDPSKSTRSSVLLKNITLSGFARSRMNRVIAVSHEILEENLSRFKEMDIEFLFCVLPILILQNKVDDIDTKIGTLEAGDKLSKGVVATVRAYLGVGDE